MTTREKDPRDNRWLLPDGKRPVHCRSCGAPMVWGETSRGKPVPLSLSTEPTVWTDENGKLHEVEASIVVIDGETWALPHHADCPQGRAWRK